MTNIGRYLSGPAPGLLDPTQPARLLRDPESTLSFADFDPLTATATGPISVTEGTLSSMKRIVIETTRGESRWRFVPGPLYTPDGDLQGSWPRFITVCGQDMICTQEQWDIYNLDPVYQCVVLAPPLTPIIYRKPPQSPTIHPTENVGERVSAPSSIPVGVRGEGKEMLTRPYDANMHSEMTGPYAQIPPYHSSAYANMGQGLRAHDTMSSHYSNEFPLFDVPQTLHASASFTMGDPGWSNFTSGTKTSLPVLNAGKPAPKSVSYPSKPISKEIVPEPITSAMPNANVTETVAPSGGTPDSTVTSDSTSQATTTVPSVSATSAAKTARSTMRGSVLESVTSITKVAGESTPAVERVIIPDLVDLTESTAESAAEEPEPSAKGITHGGRVPSSPEAVEPAESSNVFKRTASHKPSSKGAESTMRGPVADFTFRATPTTGSAVLEAVAKVADSTTLDDVTASTKLESTPSATVISGATAKPNTRTAVMAASTTALHSSPPDDRLNATDSVTRADATDDTGKARSPIINVIEDAGSLVREAEPSQHMTIPRLTSRATSPAKEPESSEAATTLAAAEEAEPTAKEVSREGTAPSADAVGSTTRSSVIRSSDETPTPVEAESSGPGSTSSKTSRGPASPKTATHSDLAEAEPTAKEGARPGAAPSADAVESTRGSSVLHSNGDETPKLVEAESPGPGSTSSQTSIGPASPKTTTHPDLAAAEEAEPIAKEVVGERTAPSVDAAKSAESSSVTPTPDEAESPEVATLPAEPTAKEVAHDGAAHNVDAVKSAESSESTVLHSIHQEILMALRALRRRAQGASTPPETAEVAVPSAPSTPSGPGGCNETPTAKESESSAPGSASSTTVKVAKSSESAPTPDLASDDTSATEEAGLTASATPAPSTPSKSGCGQPEKTRPNAPQCHATSVRPTPSRIPRPRAVNATEPTGSMRTSRDGEVSPSPLHQPSRIPRRCTPSRSFRNGSRSSSSAPSGPPRSASALNHEERAYAPNLHSGSTSPPQTAQPTVITGTQKPDASAMPSSKQRSPPSTRAKDTSGAGSDFPTQSPPATSCPLESRASAPQPCPSDPDGSQSEDPEPPTPTISEPAISHPPIPSMPTPGASPSPAVSEDVSNSQSRAEGAADSAATPGGHVPAAPPSSTTSKELAEEEMPGENGSPTTSFSDNVSSSSSPPRPPIIDPVPPSAAVFTDDSTAAASGHAPQSSNASFTTSPHLEADLRNPNAIFDESAGQGVPSDIDYEMDESEVDALLTAMEPEGLGMRKRKVEHLDDDEELEEDGKDEVMDTDEDDHEGDDRAGNTHKRRRIGPTVKELEFYKALVIQRACQRERLNERRAAMRQQRLNKLPAQVGMFDVFAHIPPQTYTVPSSGDPSTSEQGWFQTPEQTHEESIQESIRKLAELEKDKPLWDEAARVRQAREQAEAEMNARHKPKPYPTANPAPQSDAQMAPDVNMYQEEEDDAALEEYLDESRQRQHVAWSFLGRWNDTHAFRRYEVLSEAFDKAKFTADNPPDFFEIPWPTLLSPNSTRAEDLGWEAAEAFFAVAKISMSTATYNILVKKAHKRFHPDRWRSRGILKSLASRPLLQKLVEDTGNMISQAVTPIWRELS